MDPSYLMNYYYYYLHLKNQKHFENLLKRIPTILPMLPLLY